MAVVEESTGVMGIQAEDEDGVEPSEWAHPDDGPERETHLWRWAKVALIVAALLALVFAVVRATARDGSSGGGHKPPSGSSGAGFTVEQQAEFAGCMRDQGVDVTDPLVAADGRMGGMTPGIGVDVNGPDFQAALSTCQARFSPAGGEQSGGHP